MVEDGAPSPTWQQGALTNTVTCWLNLPSLVALIVATPPLSAFNVTE